MAEDHETFARETLAYALSLIELPDTEWVFANGDFGSGVRFSSRSVEGSPAQAIRVEGVVPLSPSRVFAALGNSPVNLEYQQSIDKNILEMVVLEELSPKLKIMRHTVATPFPVANREFVTVSYDSDTENGRSVSLMASRPFASVPVAKGIVRGHAILLWLISATDNENESNLVRFMLVDPKGSIPSWAVNAGKKKLAHIIRLVRELLERINADDKAGYL